MKNAARPSSLNSGCAIGLDVKLRVVNWEPNTPHLRGRRGGNS
jgi:hypothetical protein